MVTFTRFFLVLMLLVMTCLLLLVVLEAWLLLGVADVQEYFLMPWDILLLQQMLLLVEVDGRLPFFSVFGLRLGAD